MGIVDGGSAAWVSGCPVVPGGDRKGVMLELLQWMVGIGIMAAIGAVIIWDHKVTKREEKARKAKEAEKDDLYYF